LKGFATRWAAGPFRFLLSALVWVPACLSVAREVPAGGDSVIVRPCGAVPDADWALGRLNDGTSMTRASFAYPETSTPVRLYLIDTGVAHVGTWFSQNPNLKSFRSELVRSANDPALATAVSHGSQMLSLIVGPGTGAALGTPVHVVNYNIYPGGEGTTTTSGRLAAAIDLAIGDHFAHPGMRSVICIANGSSHPGAESIILEGVITEAVEAGIPVVVSAGNEGADASLYIPAAYGLQQGVICTGASDAGNQRLPISNVGPAVDLYAPGFEVRTMNVVSPENGSFATATGTSPATALTAAAALIQLSLDPTLTPAQLEAALRASAVPVVQEETEAAGVMELLVQVQPDPEGDSDRDGTRDILERFFGSDPADASETPQPIAVSKIAGGARMSFSVAAELFDAAQPFTLKDGSTWRVEVSTNLKDWQPATGTLSPSPAVNGRIPVSYTTSTGASAAFLRIEVLPPP
jgi:hypothetical protein